MFTVYGLFQAITEDFGIDWEGPLSLEEDFDKVVVPENAMDEVTQRLKDVINPLDPSVSFAIDLYKQARVLMNAHI